MFGLEDPWIALAYILNFAAVILCVTYGIRNWNKGAETASEMEEDRKWAIEEEKIDKEFE